MNEPRLIVQLVPPGSGGVRDYAECLKREWLAMGIDSTLIALGQNDAAESSLVARLDELMRADGRSCSLVLHYSGYGFHPRGLCFWLASEVERARTTLGSRLRVLTMFHELFASGPMWRSAFWLSRFQARIAARIARHSDGLWTNTALHRDWLTSKVDTTVPVTAYPVFSTIGEPELVPPTSRRSLQLVVFGAESTRHRALARLPRHAAQLRQHGVTEVIEVGSGQPYRGAMDDMAHRFLGRLGTAELHALLEDSIFGLLDYPPESIGKSTVFAAYAAFGCIALNTADDEEGTAGPFEGEHFVALGSARSIPISPQARQSMADAARHWYSGHTSTLQGKAFAELCLANSIKDLTHV